MNPLDLLYLNPVTAPVRLAGQVFDRLDTPAELNILRDNKPYVWDSTKRTYVPDLSTPSNKDAWRKEGQPSTLGRAPVKWNASKREWVAVNPPSTESTAPPAESPTDTTTDTTTAPVESPASTPDAGTSATPGTGAGTIGNQPDIPFSTAQDAVKDILSKYPEWRQAELDAEMRRYVLTGALRQQGLRELSRRKIEQENIAAWREVEKQRLASQSAQAIALANTAYLAQIPNTGVMEAMNNAMKAGISAGGLLSNTITPSTATYFS